jgi:N-acetylglucosaminyldiphosphoundecaprenol N-acetyl-beta-D-mannosaminyltransferase
VRSIHPAALPTAEPPSSRAELLGVVIDPLSTVQTVDAVERAVDERRRLVGVGVNADVVNKAAGDPVVRAAVHGSSLAYADGQSVVWAARLLGVPVPERVATTDLVWPLAQRCAERGFGLFLHGAAPGVAERAAARLVDRFPGLRVDVADGYTHADVVAAVNRSGAEVLLVGLGDPLQQQWVAEHGADLACPVVLTCGGLFDWISGDRPRPPQWMVGAGLEWAWRLRLEPRRLFTRYVVGNPRFVLRVLRARLSQRLHPPRSS